MKKKIDKIIELGLKFPTYDYDKKKFITYLPINVSTIGGGAFGVEHKTEHDEFESALDYMIRVITKEMLK